MKVDAEALTSDSPANQRVISLCGSGLIKEVDCSIYSPRIGAKTENKPSRKAEHSREQLVYRETPFTRHHEDSDPPLHLCSALSVLVNGR